MKNKFYASICFATLLGLTQAQASTILPADNTALLIAPAQPGAWVFGVEGLFVKTQALPYVSVADVPFNGLVYPGSVEPFNYVPLKQHNINPGNQTNYGADISYLFSSSKDIRLSYEHLGINSKDSYIEPDSHFVVAPLDSGLAFAGADADLAQQLNSVDLTFGQHIVIAQHLDLHPFLGLRFADITDNEDNNYYNNFHLISSDTSTYPAWGNYTRNSFIGFGPRAGFDGSVALYKGFSIDGTLAASLLVGSQDKSKEFFNYIDSSIDPSSKVSESSTIILPEADARLALAYDYQTLAGNSIDVSLGYLATTYRDVASMTPGNGNNLTADKLLSEENNLTYYGPFARLQIALNQ